MTDRAFAEHFVPGFVGVPGRRTFFIQVDDAEGRHWYLLEKAQVAAFAEYGAELLEELGLTGVGGHLELGEVVEPEDLEFRVGQMSIAVRETELSVEITLVPVEEESESAMHAITAAQLDAAVRTAKSAVARGRPICPRCDLAMDPDGHVCPTTNGDLRNHRP
jgi:uncharacterized repeat protein (TIGR03847 family)